MEDSRQAERPEGPEGAEQEQSAQRGAPPAAGAEAGNDGRGMLGPPFSKESSLMACRSRSPPLATHAAARRQPAIIAHVLRLGDGY